MLMKNDPHKIPYGNLYEINHPFVHIKTYLIGTSLALYLHFKCYFYNNIIEGTCSSGKKTIYNNRVHKSQTNHKKLDFIHLLSDFIKGVHCQRLPLCSIEIIRRFRFKNGSRL